jgi:hypothetical protein
MKPEKGRKKEKAPSSTKKEAPSPGGSFLLGAFFNVIGLAASVIFLYVIFNNIQGYDWLYNTMLKGNLETISQNPDLTIAQRYNLKSGEIGYVYRIKESSPDSAIIIIPPKDLLTKVGFKSAVELPWLTYFVYPRKVVYEDDKDSSKLYKQANYVLAVNGWGFDKLNYRVDRPESFMVLPLKK